MKVPEGNQRDGPVQTPDIIIRGRAGSNTPQKELGKPEIDAGAKLRQHGILDQCHVVFDGIYH